MKLCYCFAIFTLVLTDFTSVKAQSGTMPMVTEQLTRSCMFGDLEGTLLVPEGKGPFPLVVFISGSGPTDRDGNQPGTTNNSLRFLAEALTARGIATFRYDKHASGSSKLNAKESDLTFDHFIQDVNDWVDKLRQDSRFKELTILGHSEGSMIGMMAAAQRNADKYVSVAGPGYPADQLLKKQLTMLPPDLQSYSNAVLDSLKQGHMVTNVNPALMMLYRPSVQPYLISWFKYDPAVEIARLTIPVMIVQGTTDVQVSVDNAYTLVAAAQKGSIKVYEGMNHVLKMAEADRTLNLKTYMNPDLPLVDGLADDIAAFIKSR